MFRSGSVSAAAGRGEGSPGWVKPRAAAAAELGGRVRSGAVRNPGAGEAREAGTAPRRPRVSEPAPPGSPAAPRLFFPRPVGKVTRSLKLASTKKRGLRGGVLVLASPLRGLAWPGRGEVRALPPGEPPRQASTTARLVRTDPAPASPSGETRRRGRARGQGLGCCPQPLPGGCAGLR